MRLNGVYKWNFIFLEKTNLNREKKVIKIVKLQFRKFMMII